MFIVTLFNMVTTILILVLERTRMVGVLKSMGMCNGAVRRIFLYRAAMIIGRGLLAGNVVGIALVAIQLTTSVVKLDSAAYYVSSVPVVLDAWNIVAINIIFAVAILLLLYAATAIISRISPAEAVKYE
jgi:lipoprotein-releasing system permease protein